MTLIRNINISTLLKANPVGIDVPIQKLQIGLGSSISWLEKSFGRCFINEDEKLKTFRPEIYIGDQEYIGVFPDDITALCFFDLAGDSTQDDLNLYKQNVRLIFSLNLKKAFPLLDYRADEEAIQSVVSYLQLTNREWRNINIVRGVQNVYTNYNWTLPESGINLQPYFVFALEFEVSFNYNNLCNGC